MVIAFNLDKKGKLLGAQMFAMEWSLVWRKQRCCVYERPEGLLDTVDTGRCNSGRCLFYHIENIYIYIIMCVYIYWEYICIIMCIYIYWYWHWKWSDESSWSQDMHMPRTRSVLLYCSKATNSPWPCTWWKFQESLLPFLVVYRLPDISDIIWHGYIICYVAGS